MDTKQVANRLYELCSKDENYQAVEELYADHARHVEPMSMPSMDQITQGKAALLQNSKDWMENNEIHSSFIKKPLVNENQFVCEMGTEITPKVGPMAGQRMNLSEITLYTVENGKIVEAKFFYDTEMPE